MYLYACSLGAICANIYLVNVGSNTPIKAAAFYGTPINPSIATPFFFSHLYGFYDWVFGKKLLESIGH